VFSILTLTIGAHIAAIVLRADTRADIVWFFVLFAILVAVICVIIFIIELICKRKVNSNIVETKVVNNGKTVITIEKDGWVTETEGLLNKVPLKRLYLYVNIILVLVAVFINVYHLRLYAPGEITTATVTESDPGVYITGGGSSTHKITYEYNVDGQNYVAAKWFDSDRGTGHKVTIRYLSNSPEISAPIFGLNVLYTFAIFIIMVLLAIFAIIYCQVKKKIREAKQK
jgi:hypothetical protein